MLTLPGAPHVHPHRPFCFINPRRLAASQRGERLASVHADAADGRRAADCDRARSGPVARGCRRQAVFRCDELVVGQPVRACRRAHQRGPEASARHAGACDAGWLHPRAGGRVGRAAVGAHRPGAGAHLLRERRRLGGRDRLEDELPQLEEPRAGRPARIRLPAPWLPRRDHRRARGDRCGGVSRRVRPTADAVPRGDGTRCTAADSPGTSRR